LTPPSRPRIIGADTVLSVSLQPSRVKAAPTALVRRADGREFYLHSRYDPFEEGQFLARDVARQERALYVVLGFGLGYHVRAILDHVPASSHVMVVEPDAACLSARALATADHPAARWVRDPRLHFLTLHDPKLAPLHLADRMAALRLLTIKLVTHVPSTLTAEEFYRSIASEIPAQFPTAIQRHLVSLDRMLENDLRSLWSNLPYSWRAAPISRLAAAWAGRPLVVVSGGPSLTDALPTLDAVRDRALILATGSTARVLSERGIRPDLVISVDPYAFNLGHFVGWDTTRTPLVYYHRLHHAILPVYAGPLCTFVMHDESPLPLLAEPRAPFHRGGTVAFSALQLGHYLHANPIVFVGQDFAFAGGRTHAKGAIYGEIFDETAPPDDYILVPGVAGEPVLTSRIHEAYLLHMQDYVLNFAKHRPEIQHVNTSPLGARMRGMTYVSLSEALGALPAIDPAARQVCAAWFADVPGVQADAQRQALDGWLAELTGLLERHPGSDFAPLYRAFADTSLHAIAERSYQDVKYVYEAKYQAPSAAEVYGNRFREHLRQVAADLRQIRDGL
jgi:hypothetical protein